MWSAKLILAFGLAYLQIASAGNGTVCPTLTAAGISTSQARLSAALTASGVEMNRITMTGCPGYNWTSQKSPNQAQYNSYMAMFAVSPVLTQAPLYVGLKDQNGLANANKVSGPIGFALNGVPIYNNADENGGDAYVNEKVNFDQCNGHVDSTNAYHYHTDIGNRCFVTYSNSANRHAPMLGVMADGVPIFGQLGDNGTVPTDLDECGGHSDNTYGYYHYHVTSNFQDPYTVKCLKGCIFHDMGNPNLTPYVRTSSTCPKNAKQYDYTKMQVLWVAAGQTIVIDPNAPSPSPPPPSPSPPGSVVPSVSPPTIKPSPPPPAVAYLIVVVLRNEQKATFTDAKRASFIQGLAATLGVPTDSISIVKTFDIVAASATDPNVMVPALEITAQITATVSSTTYNATALDDNLKTAMTSGLLNNNLASSGLTGADVAGTKVSTTSTTQPAEKIADAFTPVGDAFNDLGDNIKNNVPLAIGIGVGLGVLLLAVIVGVWWWIRHKKKQAQVADDGGKPGDAESGYGQEGQQQSGRSGTPLMAPSQQSQQQYPDPVPQNRLPPLGGPSTPARAF